MIAVRFILNSLILVAFEILSRMKYSKQKHYQGTNDEIYESNVHMYIVMPNHYFATVKSVKIVISFVVCGYNAT